MRSRGGQAISQGRKTVGGGGRKFVPGGYGDGASGWGVDRYRVVCFGKLPGRPLVTVSCCLTPWAHFPPPARPRLCRALLAGREGLHHRKLCTGYWSMMRFAQMAPRLLLLGLVGKWGLDWGLDRYRELWAIHAPGRLLVRSCAALVVGCC